MELGNHMELVLEACSMPSILMFDATSRLHVSSSDFTALAQRSLAYYHQCLRGVAMKSLVGIDCE